MNADAFRQYYNYHFAENRKIWDKFIMPLSEEHFTQHVDYSIGCVRNQIVHLIIVDNNWFSELRGIELEDSINYSDFDSKEKIRAQWDKVEQDMRDYLANLRDDMLFVKPVPDHDEDKDLILWQILLHVVNHGTDHRAQILRILHDFGVKTEAQDYIFHAYENPS